MCFSCNDFCGNCKPPLQLSVLCESCGFANIMTREEYLMHRGLKHRMTADEKELHATWDGSPMLCQECGADISKEMAKRVKIKPCYRSNIVCAYPCGKSTAELKEGEEPCKKMVPIGKLADWEEIKASGKYATLRND